MPPPIFTDGGRLSVILTWPMARRQFGRKAGGISALVPPGKRQSRSSANATTVARNPAGKPPDDGDNVVGSDLEHIPGGKMKVVKAARRVAVSSKLKIVQHVPRRLDLVVALDPFVSSDSSEDASFLWQRLAKRKIPNGSGSKEQRAKKKNTSDLSGSSVSSLSVKPVSKKKNIEDPSALVDMSVARKRVADNKDDNLSDFGSCSKIQVPKKKSRVAKVAHATSDTSTSMDFVPTRTELIARLGRAIMLPSEQCRQAIGGIRESGRPMLDNRQRPEVDPDVVTRDTRKFLPNHAQIFKCLEKVIPLPHVELFQTSLEHVMNSKPAPVMESKPGEDVDVCRSGSLEGDVLCKTPLTMIAATLHGAFGPANVDICRCHNVPRTGQAVTGGTSEYFLEFTMMDCVLERKFKIACGAHAVAAVDRAYDDDDDPVTHVLADFPEHMAPRHNYRFRTAIIVVPSAGIFYCSRERRTKTHGVAGSHNPLDIGWLRLKKRWGDGVHWFHDGGYVRHLSYGNENPVGRKVSPQVPDAFVGACSVWKIGIRRPGL